MRRSIACSTLFACLMTVNLTVRAGDVEDVKAEYLRHTGNANAGNADGFIAQHMLGHTAFGPWGDMLGTWESAEAEKAGRQDVGKPANPQIRVHNIEARVYNGDAAVVTAYLRAPVGLSDGTTKQGVRRVTSVWIKQGGKWLEVHDHMSTLMTGPR